MIIKLTIKNSLAKPPLHFSDLQNTSAYFINNQRNQIIMKVKTTFFVLLFCLAFTSGKLIAQEVNKMVILEVDTDNINAGNINEMATFGQPSEISNENFNLDVQLGDVIIWQGRTMPGAGGLVRITLLKHEEGVKLLGAGRISEQDGTGVIVGRVQAGQAGDQEKYTLKFEVRQRGSQEWVEYQIDPKLSIIP